MSKISYRLLRALPVIFLFGLFCGLPLSLFAQWTSAHPGMEWRATGTGRTTGHILTLTGFNPGPSAIQTDIGPFYIPGESGHQGYIVNDTYPIEVPAFGTISIVLEGYCTNIFDLPISAGDAAPSPDSWVSFSFSGPVPGPGWQAVAGDGFEASSQPQDKDMVPTYPGTAAAFPYHIDIDEYPESVASTLITAVNALEDAYDTMVESGDILPLTYAPDPESQRWAIVQQSFWYYTSLLEGGSYSTSVFQQQLIEQLEQWANQPVYTFTPAVEEEVALTAENLWSMMRLVGQEAKLLTVYGNEQPMGPDFIDWLNRGMEQWPAGEEEAITKWLELKDTLNASRTFLGPDDFNRLNEQLDARLPELLKDRLSAINPESQEALREIAELLDFLRTDYTNSLTDQERKALREEIAAKLRQHLEQQANTLTRDPGAFKDIVELMDLLQFDLITVLLKKEFIDTIREGLQARLGEWLQAEVDRVILLEGDEAGRKIWELLYLLDTYYLTDNVPEEIIRQAKAGLLARWKTFLKGEVDEIVPSDADAADKIICLHLLLRTYMGEAAGKTLADSLMQTLEGLLQQHLSGRIDQLDPGQKDALEEILKLLDLTQQGYSSEEQEKKWFEQLIKKLNEYLRTRSELLQPDQPDFLREARALALLQEYEWFANLADVRTRKLVQRRVTQTTIAWNSRPITPMTEASISWPSVGLTGGQWKILFPSTSPVAEAAKKLSTAAWATIIGIPVTGATAYLLFRDEGNEPPLPELRDDALTLSCPGNGSINVLANDEGEGLQVTNVSEPGVASITNQGAGLLLINNLTGSSFSFTYTVADRAGQSAQATVTVTVILPAFAPTDDSFDGSPDQAITSNVLSNDMGRELMVSSFTQPEGGTLSLATATGEFTFSPMEGFCGTASFSYTVEDPCGQSGTATVTLNLPDNAPPEITCPDNITISCDQEPAPELTGFPTATDYCGSELTLTFTDEPGDTACAQTILRVWVARDEVGNEAACEQTILRIDNIAPSITCPPDRTLPCDAELDPTASGFPEIADNCTPLDQLLTTYEDVETGAPCSGTIVRTWTVTDQCGNSSSCVQLLMLEDVLPPEVTCPADVTVFCEQEHDLALTGIPLTVDDCAAPVTTDFTDDLSNFNDCEGFIVRTWTATDACGNANICQQIITVQLKGLGQPDDFHVTAARASQPLPDLPLDRWALSEYPQSNIAFQQEGMPVLSSWGYFLSERLHIQYRVGKGTGILQYTDAFGAPISSLPVEYWMQEASVRFYHGQSLLAPYTGLGNQWYRLSATDQAPNIKPVRTAPRDYHIPFLMGGLRIGLWRHSYLLLEGRTMEPEGRRWPRLHWQTEMGIRF